MPCCVSFQVLSETKGLRAVRHLATHFSRKENAPSALASSTIESKHRWCPLFLWSRHLLHQGRQPKAPCLSSCLCRAVATHECAARSEFRHHQGGRIARAAVVACEQAICEIMMTMKAQTNTCGASGWACECTSMCHRIDASFSVRQYRQ